MTGPREIALGSLDLAAFVRPGDTVLWGQAAAEPVPLTTLLMAQRHRIGHFRCFLGLTATGTCRPEHADVVTFVSYCGGGGNRALSRAGLLRILPAHYSQFPWLFASRRFGVDVVLLMLPPPEPDGTYRLGIADEYLSAAIDSARVVIAEVNDAVPRIARGRRLAPGEIDVVVPVSRPVAEVADRPPGERERAIAARVAELVPDGATLQIGIGGLPAAILRSLSGHKDLGIHSGLIVDAVAGLMEAGVITGARKTLDPGLAVTGVLMGSRRLLDFADGHPGLSLRETTYVHAAATLAAQDRFVSINAALEVDLTGQINCERVGGAYLGAVGGVVDFTRGAQRSRGGLPITVLPSTAGPHSRIVAALTGPVTIPRSDAGIIVTEHGVADLRGLGLDERRRRMLALAHPGHREELESAMKKTAPVSPRGEP